MKTTIHNAPLSHLSSRRKARRGRVVAAQLRSPEVFQFSLWRFSHFGNPQGEIPERLVFLRPDPADPSSDQLFLDAAPLPREAFRYDSDSKVLTWTGVFGGGQLRIVHEGRGALGTVGDGLHAVSVAAGSTASFVCDVALDCGAAYVSTETKVTGFSWDPASPKWSSAEWVKARLRLSYTVVTGDPMAPPTFSFMFEDLQTGSIPWQPTDGSFTAGLAAADRGDQMVWRLAFKSDTNPDPDRGTPPTGADTVYPRWLMAVEDAAAQTIDGVLEIDAAYPNGKLLGIRGAHAAPMVVGYFRAADLNAPFGVFDGQLQIDGRPVAGSQLHGNVLSWSGLDAEHQRLTGLPATGSLRFSPDGARAEDGETVVRRLAADEATAGLSESSVLQPRVHALAARALASLSDTDLKTSGLLAMDPCRKDEKGAIYDFVQAAVTRDLGEIMNSFIPSELWKLLFPTTPQPTLSGPLADVAGSPVDGVKDPSDWYRSLATATLTQGLADGSDDNCKYLNGPRAKQWLSSEVAMSKVYHAHSQALFQHHWQENFPLIKEYLADQSTNDAARLQEQANDINKKLTTQLKDIDENVTDDPSKPDTKKKLKEQIKAVAANATSNGLYWAFCYFQYNTSPAILANVGLEVAMGGGTADGTALSRMFQKNVAVLTALDPSNYFAQQYITTFNTFLAIKLLPNLAGFTGDPGSFDLIKEYLQKFVETGLASEDEKILSAAKQLKDILAGENFNHMLKESIEALRTFAGACEDFFALPYVSQNFVNWFQENYKTTSTLAGYFSSVLIGGITTLAVFNLLTDCKSFGKLSKDEQGKLITGAIQVGLQILGAVVKRGVRIYSLWNVDGMTAGERAASVFDITLRGETAGVEDGLFRVGNRLARWLGDTDKTVGMVAEDAVFFWTVTEAEVGETEAVFIQVFGKNLDEFVATRLGPLFILAGIGFSLYQLIEGEGKIEFASDILNVASGSLMLFGMVGAQCGEWVVATLGLEETGEMIFLGITEAAGPLGIVLALAGVGIMLYELFKTPPDPVEKFVNEYAKPAGLSVRSRASSIDYAISYLDADQHDFLIVGFTLAPTGGQPLICGATGAVSVGAPTNLPDSVWQVLTDGEGISQIATLVKPSADASPRMLFLTLMSDDTISFQVKAEPQATAAASGDAGPTVVSQKWRAQAVNDAVLANGKKSLARIDLTLKTADDDRQLTWDAQNGLSLSSGGTTFTLAMVGMAPNFMSMRSLSFLLDTKPFLQTFRPSFGVNPGKCTFELSGDALPGFLTFSKDTGSLTTTGGEVAKPLGTTKATLKASNKLGSASFDFTVVVQASGATPAMA